MSYTVGVNGTYRLHTGLGNFFGIKQALSIKINALNMKMYNM